MKKLMLLFACSAALVLTSCGEGEKEDNAGAGKGDEIKTTDIPNEVKGKKGPMVEFEKTEEDLGTVIEGKVVPVSFPFTNTGDEPVLITFAKGSCGCTVADYPKDPIQPGEKSEITAKFNSQNRVGKISKYVTVMCNVRTEPYKLSLKGEVVEGDNKE